MTVMYRKCSCPGSKVVEGHCNVCGAGVEWDYSTEPNRGAWGERFEFDGVRYDPSDESLPEGEFI